MTVRTLKIVTQQFIEFDQSQYDEIVAKTLTALKCMPKAVGNESLERAIENNHIDMALVGEDGACMPLISDGSDHFIITVNGRNVQTVIVDKDVNVIPEIVN